MNSPVIELRAVTKVYPGGTRALHNATLRVQEGERCCLLGPNGAGKTTILRLLDGAAAPTSGEVQLFGDPAHGRALQRAKRRIGIVPQNPGMYTDLSVRDYLQFVRSVYGTGDVEGTADAFGLASYMVRMMSTLSGGYQRRLLLAAATLSEPPVLLLDEPTVGLDPLAATETRRLLAQAMRGRTVLMSTHNLSEAEDLCDTVIIVREGAVLVHETIAVLRREAIPRVHLTARQAPETLLVALNARGIGSHIDNSSVVFPLEDPQEEMPAILRSLLNDGIEVYECRVQAPTLEDLFVNVVTST